jgi:hypothetical protein
MISLDELDQLVAEVEKEDPVDCGDLPVDEDHLRHLSCVGAMQMLADMQTQGMDPQAQFLCLLASMAKLLTDNTILQARLLQQTAAAQPELELLLSKIRRQT